MRHNMTQNLGVSKNRAPLHAHRLHAWHTSQQGFTLIELMIALVLGLLVAAAAMQVYITSIQTSTTQKSSGEAQNAGIFGVQQFEYYLRLANLGNENTSIDKTNAAAGIVTTPQNLGADSPTGATLDNTTLTSGDKASSVLVIQYTNVPAAGAAAGTGVLQYDCESNDIAVGARVIQRYFVQDNNLMCDAGRVVVTPKVPATATAPERPATAQITNYGDAGTVAISGVERFAIQLGVQTGTGKDAKPKWVSPTDYRATTTKDDTPIIAVKAAMIVKGDTPVLKFGDTDPNKTAEFLGESVTLDTNHARQVFETTTLLRNGRKIQITK